jgi:hypothetical protein
MTLGDLTPFFAIATMTHTAVPQNRAHQTSGPEVPSLIVLIDGGQANARPTCGFGAVFPPLTIFQACSLVKR